MVRSKIYLLYVLVIGICTHPISQAKSTVFEQNGIKIEFFDYVKSPDEPVVKYADGSNKIFAKQFSSCHIRPVLVKITNQGDKPIMVNSRSIKGPIISTKKAMARLQRSFSIIGWPYLESWGVYALWVVIAGIINLDLGWPDLTKIDLCKKYVSLKIPAAPDAWQEWGLGMRQGLLARIPSSLYKFYNPIDRCISGYFGSFFNRVIPLRLLSLVAAIMSYRYLSSIYRKNEQINVIGRIISGQGLRLLYPAVIQPQQMMQKMILVNMRGKRAPTFVRFDLFAHNNQDIIASFEYRFDDTEQHKEVAA